MHTPPVWRIDPQRPVWLAALVVEPKLLCLKVSVAEDVLPGRICATWRRALNARTGALGEHLPSGVTGSDIKNRR